jgi:hypothetical protein
MAHIIIQASSIIIGGEEVRHLGLTEIPIEPDNRYELADLLVTKTGSVGKFSDVMKQYKMTLPIQVGTTDDRRFMGYVNNPLSVISLSGSITRSFFGGEAVQEVIDIYNFIVKPVGSDATQSVVNIEGQAYRAYEVSFAGEINLN